jgi:hypothetical protein
MLRMLRMFWNSPRMGETLLSAACIVHLIRHSMDFASWKDRKSVAQALRAVYRAADAEAGQAALDGNRIAACCHGRLVLICCRI